MYVCMYVYVLLSPIFWCVLKVWQALAPVRSRTRSSDGCSKVQSGAEQLSVPVRCSHYPLLVSFHHRSILVFQPHTTSHSLHKVSTWQRLASTSNTFLSVSHTLSTTSFLVVCIDDVTAVCSNKRLDSDQNKYEIMCMWLFMAPFQVSLLSRFFLEVLRKTTNNLSP